MLGIVVVYRSLEMLNCIVEQSLKLPLDTLRLHCIATCIRQSNKEGAMWIMESLNIFYSDR